MRQLDNYIICLGNTNKIKNNKINKIKKEIDLVYDSSEDDFIDEQFSWRVYQALFPEGRNDSTLQEKKDLALLAEIRSLGEYERVELFNLLAKQKLRRGEELGCLLEMQSEEVVAEANQTANVQHGDDDKLEVTVRYIDESPGSSVNFAPIQDSSYYADHVVDSDLKKFFERPLLIDTQTWTVGNLLSSSIAPWDLYFNSTTVRKKLDNFAYMSCQLHIKVILNAAPFYYSAALVSYLPAAQYQGSSANGSLNPNLTSNGDGRIMGYSQRPHFWIYPQTNQGGEMALPFLYRSNWLRVGSRTAFQEMGILTYVSPLDLKNANGVATTSISIQTYAWATDVKLAGPTIQLALQADEYGIISTPASNVAKIARSLTSIPFIEPYAKATEMIASVIGKVAKNFGYTNVPVIRDVEALKNLPFHSFASAEISQPIEKLTIDPKQELTIDTRVCGADGRDELIISSFVQRESYVTIGSWQATMLPGDIILQANIVPYVAVSETTNSQPMIQTTPLAHASCLFKYWRGDIIYRFRFICSRFHRGRAILQWDPYANIIATNPGTNVVYSQIIDISESTDAEFRVPYMADNPWLLNYVDPRANQATLQARHFKDGLSVLPTYNSNYFNGRLTLRVLTVQSAPVASAEIIVIGSVRGADNLEFAGPTDPPRNTSLFSLQSDEYVDYNDNSDHLLTDGKPVAHPNRFLINMGEQILSLRQILRRTSLSRGMTFGTDTSSRMAIMQTTYSPQPLYRGYDPNGINTAVGTLAPGSNFPYNFVMVTPYNWIAPCFSGYRGSINWHINYDNRAFSDHIRTIRYPYTQTTGDYNNTTTLAVAGTNSTSARFYVVALNAGATGSSLSNQKTQAGHSINFPQYSAFRYLTTAPQYVTLGVSGDGSNLERVRTEFSVKPSYNTDTVMTSSTVELYSNIGPDFNLVFFVNTPTIVYLADPAAV